MELRLLKLFKIVAICLLLVNIGCGPSGQEKAPWPASVQFSGLNKNEIEAITSSLETLSTNVGTTLFSFEDQKEQFQITVTKMKPDNGNTSRAGFATYDGVFCTVELNEIVLGEAYNAYFEPVLWHEVGHCSGMTHNEKSGELMYYIASPKEFYRADAFSNFYSSLLKLTSIQIN